MTTNTIEVAMVQMEFVGGPLWGGKTSPVPVEKPAGMGAVTLGKKTHPMMGPMAFVAVYWFMPRCRAAFFLREEWRRLGGGVIVDRAGAEAMEKRVCSRGNPNKKRRRKRRK